MNPQIPLISPNALYVLGLTLGLFLGQNVQAKRSVPSPEGAKTQLAQAEYQETYSEFYQSLISVTGKLGSEGFNCRVNLKIDRAVCLRELTDQKVIFVFNPATQRTTIEGPWEEALGSTTPKRWAKYIPLEQKEVPL